MIERANTPRLPWLFCASVDLAVFLGTALVSLALLAVGWRFGLLEDDAPEWTWVGGVLLVDVAHVYATAFRVYLAPGELARRPLLYLGVPLASYVVGLALYSEGEPLFWRALAYLAVFHFVRQQYGWVALYRARAGESGRVARWIDMAAIYLATLYPLAWWHANLPRQFAWFLAGDFGALPNWVASAMQVAWFTALSAYSAKSAWNGLRYGKWNPGKDIVVATTALLWHIGIVTFNSDYAFTICNVLIHGVPYMALVYWTAEDQRQRDPPTAGCVAWSRLGVFLASIWLLAFVEEFLWDRGVWHERTWLFGRPWDWGGARAWIAPALAVPQAVHYVLDGFIWRRKSNPNFVLVSRG